jgi:hypothetical protein
VAERVYTTPLCGKLGIRAGSRVAILGAPPGAEARLEPIPSGVRVTRAARPVQDVVVVFATRLKDLARRFPAAKRALGSAGGIWVCYPKRSSNVDTDLTFDVVQRLGLGAGLVDNKSIAWDETWSAVRFVYRLVDRPR